MTTTVKKEEVEMNTKTDLLPAERYLKTGAHIGTRYKSGEMARYVYKQRPDGLKVMDIAVIDARIKLAAKMLSQYPAHSVIAIARKLYSQTSAKAFAQAIGGKSITGRFIPGTFTNPMIKTFVEPKVILVAEPESDAQAIKEASQIGIAVVAFCSTNNSTANVDFVIPVNNKGRKSLGLTFWLLAREYLKARGEIKNDAEFTMPIESFEYQVPESENQLEESGERRPFRRNNDDRDDRPRREGPFRRRRE